jgi:hypothetical protein
MLNFSRFSEQEDTFLKVEFKNLPVSRLAFKLGRPYFVVEQRCIALGILKERQSSSRYYCDDEVEFNLLVNGCTEEEIRELRGSRRVFSSDSSAIIQDDD